MHKTFVRLIHVSFLLHLLFLGHLLHGNAVVVVAAAVVVVAAAVVMVVVVAVVGLSMYVCERAGALWGLQVRVHSTVLPKPRRGTSSAPCRHPMRPRYRP